jgi:hypothetical protein
MQDAHITRRVEYYCLVKDLLPCDMFVAARGLRERGRDLRLALLVEYSCLVKDLLTCDMFVAARGLRERGRDLRLAVLVESVEAYVD